MNCIRIVSPCPRPRPRPCPLLTGGKVGVHVQPHFVPAAGHLQQVLLALVVVHKRHAAVAKHGRRAAPRRRGLGRRRSEGCLPRSAPSLLGLRQLARRGQHAEKHAARARGDATRAGRRAAWAFSGLRPWLDAAHACAAGEAAAPRASASALGSDLGSGCAGLGLRPVCRCAPSHGRDSVWLCALVLRLERRPLLLDLCSRLLYAALFRAAARNDTEPLLAGSDLLCFLLSSSSCLLTTPPSHPRRAVVLRT